MQDIIYYVAISLDGFIAGPNEDISGFIAEGEGVNQYLADLQGFKTVIMGRKTYEFGYRYGLQPGQPAYPHMEHYIFSNSLQLEQSHEKVKVFSPSLEAIQKLRQEATTPIYLCGGGTFAAWLLEHEQIDVLKIKLNPFVQGQGIQLFEKTNKAYQLELKESKRYEGGLQIMTYKVKY